MSEEQFVQHDFNLPSHTVELKKAEEAISKLKFKVELTISNNLITDESLDKLLNDIVKVLDYVGRLSMTAFEVGDQLEALYTLKYPHAPELARKLWQEHYESLHHPYNILKNRCYRMLEELDEAYIKKFNKFPVNYHLKDKTNAPEEAPAEITPEENVSEELSED